VVTAPPRRRPAARPARPWACSRPAALACWPALRKASPSVGDGGPHTAAGQDRVAGATNARPRMRIAPEVTKPYRPVCKAAVSVFARSGISEVSARP
jgi:hypothetical protein